MEFYPVVLKCPERDKRTWINILNVLKEANIDCSDLKATNEGFKAFFKKQDSVDKVLSDEVIAKLGDVRCIPVKPSYLTSNRTIIVKSANSFIMEHSDDAIMENINGNDNDWLEVSAVHKFPSGKTFKIECKTTEMASLCLKNGFYTFNLSVSPAKLALEESHQVVYCCKCYELNEHMSKNCRKPQSYTVCSLCASDQHTYKECKSDHKKCLNCEGLHATMAKNCPKYKEVLAQKNMNTDQILNKQMSQPEKKLEYFRSQSFIRQNIGS